MNALVCAVAANVLSAIAQLLKSKAHVDHKTKVHMIYTRVA